MSSTIETIALHDDVAVIRATEKLLERLAQAFEPVSGSVVAELRNMPDHENSGGKLLDYLDQHGETVLDDHMSVIEARRLLVAAAGKPALGQLVSDCLAAWPDNRNRVGLALTYGTLISMWLMMLTTECRFEVALPDKDGKRILIVEKKSWLPDIGVELTRHGVKLDLVNASKERQQTSQAASPAPSTKSLP